jgi:hypothetical protein
MLRMNARVLKAMLPQTPIILFTSHHAGFHKDYNARANGIDAVVAKGHDMSFLLNSVQNLLQEA